MFSSFTIYPADLSYIFSSLHGWLPDTISVLPASSELIPIPFQSPLTFSAHLHRLHDPYVYQYGVFACIFKGPRYRVLISGFYQLCVDCVIVCSSNSTVGYDG